MSLELQSTLSLILQQLASFFGESVETVTAAAPEWLAKYGWFTVWGDIGFFTLFGLILYALACLGIGTIISDAIDDMLLFKKFISVIVIIGFIVLMFLTIGIPLIRCNIAPEIYGLNELITKLNLR